METPEFIRTSLIPCVRTLCPVRSLRYYLDKTKDLRADKELAFVSFRKSFKKDIVPATVSSWIKQTIGLCYQLSDEQAQDLHQVRAHDVRAFAASKAFQGGVPLYQILSACHWKFHNTFTQFYLKDVAWALQSTLPLKIDGRPNGISPLCFLRTPWDSTLLPSS